jgi:1-acyl-sn-glycerol-3-phosphate acyltransferase
MFIVIYLVLLILYAKIASGWGRITRESALWIIDRLYAFCARFMKWDTQLDAASADIVRALGRDAGANRVLCISNHVAVVDFMHYIHLFRRHMPDHDIILVTKRAVQKQPLVGSIVRELCIIVEDDIPAQLDRLTAGTGKSVLLLFPEGKIFDSASIERSNRWCQKKQFEPYSRVVCPHSKGIMTLIRGYEPDVILGGTMYYADELYRLPQEHPIQHGLYYGKEFYHYLTNQLPRLCRIGVQRLPRFRDLARELAGATGGAPRTDEAADLLMRMLWRNMDAAMRDAMHRAVFAE